MPAYTEIYADFIRNTRYESLTPQTIAMAKKCLLDLVGVSIAGLKLMEFPKWVVDTMAGMGGAPEATIIGQKSIKFPALNAALANGACAHALDMDDGHRFSAGHPGVTVIPAAIAAAEATGANTKSLLNGIVVGYDVFIRIASAINPSSLNRGFHTTGTVGPFGAAVACASIMGLSRDEIIWALGLAGLQGAGIMEVMHDDEAAKVKSLHPGKATQAGLLAAILAKKGARGPLAVMEGGDGFFRAFADKVNEEYLTKGLGTTFEINNTYVKFYPACRHAHVAIDAALLAKRRDNIDAANIEKIKIESYPVALKLCRTVHPNTPSAARFSLPFCVAAALIQGKLDENSFAEANVRDEKIQALAGKVELTLGEKWVKSYPAKRGVGLTITMKDGKTSVTEMDLAVGEPENPAKLTDFSRKFYANAATMLPDAGVKKLEETILNIEEHTIGELGRLLEL